MAVQLRGLVMDMIRNHKHYARHIFMGLVYKTRHFTDSGILLKYYGKKGEIYSYSFTSVLRYREDSAGHYWYWNAAESYTS